MVELPFCIHIEKCSYSITHSPTNKETQCENITYLVQILNIKQNNPTHKYVEQKGDPWVIIVKK